MSTPLDPNDPVAVANELIGTLGGMTKQFEALSKRQVDTAKYSHHTRRLGFGLAASVLLGIILSIVVVFSLIGQVHQNTTFRNAQNAQNKAQAAALVTSCQASNVNKANDIKLWDDLLTDLVAKPTTATPTVQKELTALHKLINVRDQPINCIARYH
jgi:uncharacterized protein YlxW (UPF0749 family)